MNVLLRLAIASTLSLLYIAYFIEMYRHLKQPLEPIKYEKKKKKIRRLLYFFLAIGAIIILAYIIRQFILPKPVFDLIVASLQLIFVIPFFGALFTDHLLHAWKQRRLPASIKISIFVLTAIIGFGTNLMILFASPHIITITANILNTLTDISSVFLILLLAFLGFQYWHSSMQK